MSDPSSTAPTDASSLLVFHFGKRQEKRAVKRLRKGKGKLTRKLHDMVGDLREGGEIPIDAQVVVVIVREKPRRRHFLPGL
jgi:hypothetical protein